MFPALGVQPMRYHDALVSTVNATGFPQEHNTSLGKMPAHTILYIQLS